MARDLRSENDNLLAWRTKKAQLTQNLLNRSLEDLISLHAIINQKTVCEMMAKLATEEDKEYKAIISSSAVSKNELYKNMILEAKQKIKLSSDGKNKYKIDGDKQLEVFQLKTLIAKKEATIKELESIIKRANIKKGNHQNITINSHQIDYKRITQDLINFILQEGIGYIDSNQNLINESNGDILISSNIIRDL